MNAGETQTAVASKGERNTRQVLLSQVRDVSSSTEQDLPARAPQREPTAEEKCRVANPTVGQQYGKRDLPARAQIRACLLRAVEQPGFPRCGVGGEIC